MRSANRAGIWALQSVGHALQRWCADAQSFARCARPLLTKMFEHCKIAADPGRVRARARHRSQSARAAQRQDPLRTLCARATGWPFPYRPSNGTRRCRRWPRAPRRAASRCGRCGGVRRGSVQRAFRVACQAIISGDLTLIRQRGLLHGRRSDRSGAAGISSGCMPGRSFRPGAARSHCGAGTKGSTVRCIASRRAHQSNAHRPHAGLP
jgi:hypothetical protein